MSFTDPGDFAALEVVDEDDLNTIADDLVYLSERIVPTGVVFPFVGTAAPSGYLLCDGSPVSRATYATLYALIGDAYGPGNGSTTFNLPNMQQRFPLGKAASGTGSTMGSAGGSKDAVTVSHGHTASSAGRDLTHHHWMQHNHGADDNHIGSHEHSIDGDYGLRIAVTTNDPQNWFVNSSGANRNQGMTFSDIDADGAHNHDISVDNGWRATTDNSENGRSNYPLNHDHGVTVNSNGSSGTDANLPPFQVFTYIIKF